MREVSAPRSTLAWLFVVAMAASACTSVGDCPAGTISTGPRCVAEGDAGDRELDADSRDAGERATGDATIDDASADAARFDASHEDAGRFDASGMVGDADAGNARLDAGRDAAGAVDADVRCGNGRTDFGEDCDDGNASDGDGCDHDCTYSCVSSADCDDGNRCNDEDVCRDHVCLGLAVAPCTASDTCHSATCMPATGECVQRLVIDADGDGYAPAALGACGTDCDDGNGAVHPGAAEICNFVDDDCDRTADEGLPLVPCYADLDHDTYGTALTMRCTCMPTEATRGGDCFDSATDVKAGSVHPNQTSFFTMSYTGPSGVSFDYDCDGALTDQFSNYNNANACSPRFPPSDGCYPPGWTSVVPSCGSAGPRVTCDSRCITTSTADVVRGCR